MTLALIRYAISISENQFHTELHLTRWLSRAEDSAEVGTERDPSRDIEMGGVEYIEDFPPEFNPMIFSNSEIALERHVQVAQAWTNDHVASRVPESKRRRLDKS